VVQRLALSVADYKIFAALDRHGPLPTRFLYEFVRSERRDYSHFQNRLTEFYHGDRNGPYLTRPPQQFDSYAARYQHLVYDLTPRARHALAEANLLLDASLTRASSFLHQLMQASIAASFELGALEEGLKFISRADILHHPKCPKAMTDSVMPFVVPVESGGTRMLIPDDVFGLEYPGQGYRFFALEADRNTESIRRSRLDQTAFGRKVDGYVAAIAGRVFERQWGIPNLTVLTITTNRRHAENLLAYVAGRGAGALASRFAFAVEPTFGTNWRVPNAPLWNLLSEPWITTEGPKVFGRC
jgi:hypothetical protein